MTQSTYVGKYTFLTPRGLFGHFNPISFFKMVVVSLVLVSLNKFLGLADTYLQFAWGIISAQNEVDVKGCFTHGVAGVTTGK